MPSDDTHELQICHASGDERVAVPDGMNLRAALRAHDHGPHGPVSQYLNCGGRGHCALCLVHLGEDAPPPRQWLDALTARLGRRVSCQLQIDRDLTVRV